MPDKKICFIISPTGGENPETKKRSEQIYKHIIKPALEHCGYRPVRSDQISEPGTITSQVIQQVVDAPLLVADLTGTDPKVFYELAIRHALRKPVVQVIKKGEHIPFNVSGAGTIHIDLHDLDSVEEAKKEIVGQIKAVEEDASQVETPISIALDLKILKQQNANSNEMPNKRFLADIAAIISELRDAVSKIEKKLSNPEALIPPEYFERAFAAIGAGTGQPQKRYPDASPGLIDALEGKRLYKRKRVVRAPETANEEADENFPF